MRGCPLSDDAQTAVRALLPLSLVSADIHIFTSSKQPWVQLRSDIPSVAEYYERESYWPPESLARRLRVLPKIEAYQASVRTNQH